MSIRMSLQKIQAPINSLQKTSVELLWMQRLCSLFPAAKTATGQINRASFSLRKKIFQKGRLMADKSNSLPELSNTNKKICEMKKKKQKTKIKQKNNDQKILDLANEITPT